MTGITFLCMNFFFQAKRCWRRPQVSLMNVIAITSTTKLALTKHFWPFLLSEEVVCGLVLICNFLKSWRTEQVSGSVVPHWPELL